MVPSRLNINAGMTNIDLDSQPPYCTRHIAVVSALIIITASRIQCVESFAWKVLWIRVDGEPIGFPGG